MRFTRSTGLSIQGSRPIYFFCAKIHINHQISIIQVIECKEYEKKYISMGNLQVEGGDFLVDWSASLIGIGELRNNMPTIL